MANPNRPASVLQLTGAGITLVRGGHADGQTSFAPWVLSLALAASGARSNVWDRRVAYDYLAASHAHA